MNWDNKVLTINNIEYLVIESVTIDNNVYVYLVNNNDESDSMFREIVNDNGLEIRTIDPDFFKTILLPLFSSKIANN